MLGALDVGGAQGVGVPGLGGELVGDGERGLQGQRGEGGQQLPGDGGVQDGAGQVLADRRSVADAVVLADVIGHDGAVGAGVVADRHAPSASAADDEALEQGGSLAGWPGCAVVAAGGGVGGQDLQVGLVAGPGDVAGVVAGEKDGPVLGRLGQRVVVPVQVGDVAGAAVAVGAGVAGVVQDLQDLVVGECPEVELACVRPAAVPGGEGQLRLAERLDYGEGRAGGGEGVEQQADRLAHSAVGIQDRFAAAVAGQPDRQLQPQFAAAGLGQDPAAQPGPQEMQFCFAELAFHPQEEPVVEAGRVIEPVLVQDEGVAVGADLQQPVPVCVVAGQP